MVLNIARLILCLLAGHVFMVSASIKECDEAKEFARCIEVFHHVFQNADKNQNTMDVYCDAFKEVNQCVTSNAWCVGSLIELHRFMVLQHLIVDSKLGICPNNDFESLKNIVHASEKYRMKIAGLKNVDADQFKPCAARRNLYCVSRLAEDIRNGGEICQSYAKYYACYESKPMACDDKIFKDFVADLTIFGEKLVKIAKRFPNLFKC